jgi:hypothetical protein
MSTPNVVTFWMPPGSLVQVNGFTDGGYSQRAVITGLTPNPITLSGTGMQATMPGTPLWATCPAGTVTVTITNSGPTPQSQVVSGSLTVGGGTGPSAGVSVQVVASEDSTDGDYNDCTLTFTSFVRK